MDEMAGPAGVSVVWSSVEAGAEAGGWEFLQLLFEQADARRLREAMDACVPATRHANASVPDETTEGAGVDPSARGPAVTLHYPGTRESLQMWLAAFADALTRAGWCGRVLALPWAHMPADLRAIDSRRRPAAYLAYSLDVPVKPAPGTPARWGVRPEVTARLCRDLADWATVADGEVVLRTGTARVAYDGADAAGLLAWTLGEDYGAGVMGLTTDPVCVRQVEMHLEGTVACQLEDTGRTWRERLDDLRMPLCAQPEALDHGFIRSSTGWGTTWRNLANAAYRLADPSMGGADIVGSRMLWDRFVLDVHGVQVLTGAHLERVKRGLDGWAVRELAPDRYLVEARDLYPWYAQGDPEPEVLAEARRDFAPLLLTPASLAEPR